MQVGIVSCAGTAPCSRLLLLGAGEGGVEVIEIESFQLFAAAQNGMLQLAADVAGKQAGAGDAGTEGSRAGGAARGGKPPAYAG